MTDNQGAVDQASDEPDVATSNFLRQQWDRVGAWACVVVGAMSLLIGWMGVSDTPFTAEQIPFVISGGIGGVFLLGLGAMLWISADLRDEWRKLDEIATMIRELHESEIRPSPGPVGSNGMVSGSSDRRRDLDDGDAEVVQTSAGHRDGELLRARTT